MAVSNFSGSVSVTAPWDYVTTVNGSSVRVREAPPAVGSAFRLSSTQIDLPYVATGTLAAAGTADIDLSAAGFSSIKFFAVWLTTATGQLKIGGTGPSNIHSLWFGDDSDFLTIYPGGPPFLTGSTTASTVDGSNKNVRLTNSHGSESAGYEVWVWGID